MNEAGEAPSLARTRSVAAKAARRLLLADAIAQTGAWLLRGALVALAILVIDQAIGPAKAWAPAWALVAAPIALGGFIGVALAVARRRSPIGAAVELDARLGTKDRLSAALEFADPQSRSGADPAFVALAQADAERLARDVNARRVAPLRADDRWWWWPGVAALALLVGFFAPRFDLLRPGHAARAKHELLLAAQRDEAALEIEAAQAEARETVEELAPGATPDQLEALNDLSRELGEQRSTGEEAKAAAAGRLDDAAGELDRQAEDAERRLGALADAASRAAAARGASEQGAEAEPSLAEQIEDALARGDFETAADALETAGDALRAEGDSALSPEERQRLGQELSDLAERLRESADDAAKSGAGADAESEQDAARDLQDLGVPPTDAEALANETDESTVREALEKQGMSPQSASEAAKRSTQKARERESKKQAQRDAQKVADGIKSECENPQSGHGGSKPGEQGESGQEKQGGEQAGESHGAEGASGGAKTLRQLEKQRRDAQGARSAAERLRDQSRQLAKGSSHSESPSAHSPDDAKGGGGSNQTQTSGDGAGVGSQRGPAQIGAPPEPTTTQDVDIRRPPRDPNAKDAQRVAAEWFNPDGTIRRGEGGVSKEPLTDRVRVAAAEAEQALEEQSVPPRYRKMLKKYFERLPGAVEPGAPRGPAPQPAKDAEPGAPAPQTPAPAPAKDAAERPRP